MRWRRGTQSGRWSNSRRWCRRGRRRRCGCSGGCGCCCRSSCCNWCWSRYYPSPHDHLYSGPDCGMLGSSSGSVDDACTRPTIRGGTVSAAGVERTLILTVPAPHDHFIAGPNCCVVVSARRDINDTRRCPTVCIRIVPAAGVGVARRTNGSSAPDDHFTATPNCCVRRSTLRRVSRASSYPTIAGWIVSAASVQRKPRAEGITSPDDHFGTSPHCRVIVSGGGRVDDASAHPAICGGIVSPAGAVISTAPDDHFAASPDRLVICPASTAVSYPVVGFRIVSSAVIEVGIGPRRNIEKES